MIYVVATTPVKPGQIDAFIAGHKKCIAETRKEKEEPSAKRKKLAGS